MRPLPGTRLTFRWRKWDGSPHWRHDCYYLGSDRWGDWFGQPRRLAQLTPGPRRRDRHADITLLPPSGDYALTMNAPPNRTRVYIDIAWDVRWSEEGEPTGIDMDLDVVDHTDRGIYIDDRDEWDEHRVRYGYPLAHRRAPRSARGRPRAARDGPRGALRRGDRRALVLRARSASAPTACWTGLRPDPRLAGARP